ncbi:hypothetical protein FM104_13095 [Microbacterium esteraromaticum]|uniref:Uncharacterized protein n=1 Tax=Microbacterium esteraromaticum TaxID=57043 RepID=A0A1R4KI97_9MICO|nr:hypothetical protein FM104_13095 [Microbacterium esteraromaticum]
MDAFSTTTPLAILTMALSSLLNGPGAGSFRSSESTAEHEVRSTGFEPATVR